MIKQFIWILGSLPRLQHGLGNVQGKQWVQVRATIWHLYQQRGGYHFRFLAQSWNWTENQNLMEFFLRPEQSPRYSTKEAAGGHNNNNMLIFSWHPSCPRPIWFRNRQHHYHHHIIYITFLLVSIISPHHRHFFLIKFLRLKSTNYKFSDSGAASHLVLPVLLLVMSSLSFRLV